MIRLRILKKISRPQPAFGEDDCECAKSIMRQIHLDNSFIDVDIEAVSLEETSINREKRRFSTKIDTFHEKRTI